VQMGQKDLLIDTQGNWGNILTGDRAAAPRYIEARLSKFALDTVFNPKTTQWQASYDGRNKEPISLPVKFPLLLAQGAEGIAVGLSSKILPHNMRELCEAAILYLKGKPFKLYPDFPTGGSIDASRYNDGQRGGSVKVRAKIEKLDNKTLVIREIPFSKNTTTLIESILKAIDKGKIKAKRVDDNTAAEVEIQVHLAPGISSDKTIDALYAFSDCEINISPNCCVIEDNKPCFLTVSEVLRHNVDSTMGLLRLELQIRKDELLEQLFFSSLEKIFIEERIYKDKKFVFDDLEIIVSSKYNFLNTEKMQKQYEGKDIIEIPVQVKNVESTENNFSISYLKIYNEKGEEIRELGSLFKDKSFENSPKLGKGEMTIKNIYIPYNGNGKYKMVFKTFYEEKELEMEIKK